MFREDLTEFLDPEQGFAVNGTVIQADGMQYVLTGILSSDYVDIDSGMAGVAGSSPCFECREDDISRIRYDDSLQVSGKHFRIKAIKPDGTGWAVLVLEEQ